MQHCSTFGTNSKKVSAVSAVTDGEAHSRQFKHMRQFKHVLKLPRQFKHRRGNLSTGEAI
jgi:hypothetical protein